VRVAGLDEESFPPILCQVREVPGTPPDHGEAERHRLAPHRPVRLAGSREHEDVGRPIEGRHVLERKGPVHDDAAGEVGLGKASSNACRVAAVGRLVAGEVERPRVGRKSRERVEKLEDPLSRQPIGHGEERDPAPSSKVRSRTLGRRRHVAPRGHDSDARAREPCSDELLGEVVARRDQEVGSSQREAIELCLHRLANGPMIDPAGRLMEDADQGNAGTAQSESRTCKRSGDRVEEKGARAELLGSTKHRCAMKRRERKRPLGKGHEGDLCRMRGRSFGHPQVVQVTTAEAVGIA
jgi:hypothetical protein